MRPMGQWYPGLKQELNEGWVPSQTLPSTSLPQLLCCGKEKPSPCPPARLLTSAHGQGQDTSSGHGLFTPWRALCRVTLRFTPLMHFPFSQAAERQPGLEEHPRARSTNTAEMHLNLIKFSPHCSCQQALPKALP